MSDPEPTPSPYDRLGEYYELEHRDYQADVAFYAECARRTAGPILELGVGAGRVLLQLAQRGFEGVGIDTSRTMLSLAGRRAAEMGIQDRIELVLADMADFALPGRPLAGLVYAALDSFLELGTQDRQLSALRSARRSVQADGLLVLDLINPLPEIRTESGGEVLAGPTLAGARGRVDKFVARTLDPVAQSITSRLWYDESGPDGAVRRLSLELHQRYLHLAEIDLLLRLGGFERAQAYGTYDLEPYEQASERLLVTARPTHLS